MAAQAGLPTASKPDSQEICFIPDHDYGRFIEEDTGRAMPEGNFVTADGQVLGRHRGIARYTVGQRKGLGLAMGQPGFCDGDSSGDQRGSDRDGAGCLYGSIGL